jgi:CBS domain-containing protein
MPMSTSPLVRDCMTSPAVVESPDASMAKLAAVMRLRRISALPIVRDGQLAGIVSTTDILRAPQAARASEIMSTALLTVAEHDRVEDAARRFVAGRVHHLVVVGDRPSEISAVITPRDAIEGLLDRRVAEPISSIMTTPVETVDVGDSIEECVRRLASANVHGLVVTDGGQPVGVFTHVEALAARGLPHTLAAQPVETAMSYETICLDVHTRIDRAARYMASMDVRRILVVEHRRIAGVVSALDIVDALARAA